MLLLIDNYDSFTFNLVHYLGELGAEVEVHRNDKVTTAAVLAADPDAIVLSPGPCTPREAGICLDLIARGSEQIPIFGVCLGLQGIVEAFGGELQVLGYPMHGKHSLVTHNGRGVFEGLPSPFRVGRYHSLYADRRAFPSCLEITAESDDGIIMGVRHRDLPIEAVQFHPESILTLERNCGLRLMENMIEHYAHAVQLLESI